MQILRKIGLKCECASPHWLHPYSHGVAGYRCRLRKPLLHDTVAEDTQRPAAIRGVPYPICDPSPCHRRRFRQYCGECIIYSRSLTSQIHSTAIVSLYPRGGPDGERSRCYATAFTQRRRARNEGVICRPTPESTRPTRSVCKNNWRFSCRTRTLKYALLPDLFPKTPSRLRSQTSTNTTLGPPIR